MKYINNYNEFINENADDIFYKENNYNWMTDGYCFGYYDDEFFIGINIIHSDLIKLYKYDDFYSEYKLKMAKKDHIDLNSDEYNFYEPPDITRYEFEYPGRFWEKAKVISFWKTPRSKKIFKKIAKDIKKQTKINILSNGWKIEINNKFIDIDDFYDVYKQEKEKINKNIQHHIPGLKRKKGYYEKEKDSYLYKRLEKKYKK